MVGVDVGGAINTQGLIFRLLSNWNINSNSRALDW